MAIGRDKKQTACKKNAIRKIKRFDIYIWYLYFDKC